MGREIADLFAEIRDIRLTIRTIVWDKQTYRDAGNRGMRGGFCGETGGRGLSGVPRWRSPQPPSGDEDGEETILEATMTCGDRARSSWTATINATTKADARRLPSTADIILDTIGDLIANMVDGRARFALTSLNLTVSKLTAHCTMPMFDEGPEEVEERLTSEVDDLYDGPPTFDKEPSGLKDEAGTTAIKIVEEDTRLYMLQQFHEGKCEVAIVDDGALSKSILGNKTCYLLDCGSEVFVWVGRVTQVEERKSVIRAAEDFMAHQGMLENKLEIKYYYKRSCLVGQVMNKRVSCLSFPLVRFPTSRRLLESKRENALQTLLLSGLAKWCWRWGPTTSNSQWKEPVQIAEDDFGDLDRTLARSDVLKKNFKLPNSITPHVSMSRAMVESIRLRPLSAALESTSGLSHLMALIMMDFSPSNTCPPSKVWSIHETIRLRGLNHDVFYAFEHMPTLKGVVDTCD
ncbi:villin-like 1 [Striga asiatica]|uniref:Villin-like 1 n=1 Tax=Striga asiatica TaxID=4170 RepID=A0A5A7PAZ4_STRAF|nr:villin-like 1 [Striga asiatica]